MGLSEDDSIISEPTTTDQLRNRSKERRQRILQNRAARLTNIDPSLAAEVPDTEDTRDIIDLIPTSDRAIGQSAEPSDLQIKDQVSRLFTSNDEQLINCSMLEAFMKSATGPLCQQGDDVSTTMENCSQASSAATTLNSLVGLLGIYGDAAQHFSATRDTNTPSLDRSNSIDSGTVPKPRGLKRCMKHRMSIVIFAGIAAVLVSRLIQLYFGGTNRNSDSQEMGGSFFFKLNSVAMVVFAFVQLSFDATSILAQALDFNKATNTNSTTTRTATTTATTSPATSASNITTRKEIVEEKLTSVAGPNHTTNSSPMISPSKQDSTRQNISLMFWNFLRAGQHPFDFLAAHFITLLLPAFLLLTVVLSTRRLLLLIFSLLLASSARFFLPFNDKCKKTSQDPTPSSLTNFVEAFIRQMPTIAKLWLDGKRLFIEYCVFCVLTSLTIVAICGFNKSTGVYRLVAPV